MVRALCGELPFTANAPAFVEILGWEKDGKRYFAAINQQETAPIATMFGIEIIFPYDVKSAKIVETGKALSVNKEGKNTVIRLPELHIFLK